MEKRPPEKSSKRRRPRRGRSKPKPAEDGASSSAKNAEGGAPSPFAAKGKIDLQQPAEVPLSAAEVHRMRMHLEFLGRYRKHLRLKVNASEDLLLNGAKEPTHRGVCMHLLAKIDRNCVNAALSRNQDPELRTKLLEGIVRFSTDIEIALLYLESLSESAARADAAAALTAGLQRIDFAQASAARMRRVLDLIVDLFDPSERPQLLLGLLGSDSFRTALDNSMDALPEPLAEILMPLRNAHTLVFAGKHPADPESALLGTHLLLAGSEAVLVAHPEAARQRLCELAPTVEKDEQRVCRLFEILLPTFPPTGRLFSQVAMSCASYLLRTHQDDAAAQLLETVQKHHPRFQLPTRWLAALQKPRIGRVAELEPRPTKQGRLQRGFWLEGQRQVWLRVGTPDDATQMQTEQQLHRQLVVPGIPPLLEAGVADDGTPYVAAANTGDPLGQALKRQHPTVREMTELAREGVALLSTLAHAGVVLPDAQTGRFLLDRGGRPWLVNLAGAKACAVEQAQTESLATAIQWCSGLWRQAPAASPQLAIKQRVAQASSFRELADTLSTA